MVERSPEKAGVGGSTPSLATIILKPKQSVRQRQVCQESPSNQVAVSREQSYQAQAYASTRGSAPALNTPVVESRTIPAFEPKDHAGTTRSL